MPMKRPIKEDTRYLPEPVREERIPEPVYEERTPIITPTPTVTPPTITPPTPEIKTPPPPPQGRPGGFAKGGKVMSASRRGDGIAQRGKTKGKIY